MKRYVTITEAAYQNLKKTIFLKKRINEVKEMVQQETNSIYPQVAEFAQRINVHLNEVYELTEELTEIGNDQNIAEQKKLIKDS